MVRYLIEDLNTHCDYNFYKYEEAHAKFEALKNQTPNAKIIMTRFFPDYKHSKVISEIIDSTI